MLIAISADIRRSVEAFEPRIKVTGVHYQPDPDLPLELNFRLDCQVRLEHREEQVQLDVAMHGRDGYTRVK
ncbi:GPW/gp25 family protein [Pseudomonas vranovensis]|uniref:GPW/gp25 family protein n=1 Tax=Pseudomonas vranovensis TaxID=321661 RepID=UPI003D96F645